MSIVLLFVICFSTIYNWIKCRKQKKKKFTFLAQFSCKKKSTLFLANKCVMAKNTSYNRVRFTIFSPQLTSSQCFT